MPKPKLYLGQSEHYLFYKIEDQKGNLVEKKKFKLTDKNKHDFWGEAACKILPVLEELVPVCERKAKLHTSLPYIGGRDYEIIRELPPHKPLSEEQASGLAVRINLMNVAYF